MQILIKKIYCSRKFGFLWRSCTKIESLPLSHRGRSSDTCNAPLEAFEDAGQIFEGKDVDGVFFYFHKAQQFVGMERLPAFACYDVLKNPNITR